MPKLFALCWLLLVGVLHGQAVLEPPFGLKWGDSPEHLINWAAGHKLDVQVTIPGSRPGMRIIRVDAERGNLPDSKARAVEGRFINGRLIEVTEHYGRPGDGANLIETRFAETKKRLTLQHGKLTANQKQRKVEDQFSTHTTSLHREPVQGLFLLIAFTEVEDLLRKSRSATYSVIYRNDNLRRRLEAAPATGGGGSGSR